MTITEMLIKDLFDESTAGENDFHIAVWNPTANTVKWFDSSTESEHFPPGLVFGVNRLENAVSATLVGIFEGENGTGWEYDVKILMGDHPPNKVIMYLGEMVLNMHQHFEPMDEVEQLESEEGPAPVN